MRLSSLVVDKESCTVNICFVLPYEYYNETFKEEDGAAIKEACLQILPSQFEVVVRFTKCLLGEDIVKKYIYDFFVQNYLAMLNAINFKSVRVEIKNNVAYVSIPLAPSVVNFCVKAKVDKELAEFLRGCYSEDSKISFEESGAFDVSTLIERDMKSVMSFSTVIHTSNHLKLYGKEITLNPKYISTKKTATDQTCVCGNVVKIERKISKKETVYHLFTIDDTTATLSCIHANRGKKSGALDCVKEGESVVLVGRLVEDEYIKGLKLIVSDAAYCAIDFDSIKAQQDMLILSKKNRKPVEPKVFENLHMQSLLDDVQEEADNGLFEDNVFVVFDLETTGTHASQDKIVEIGAVKIVDGQIVDYFNTLVDPKMPMPQDASGINHIYDKDLVEAPYFEDIMQSFLDYVKGAVMVAHNAPFDMTFMKNACAELGVCFDNRYFDTLELSRKAQPKQTKHNLAAMCKTYDITIENAHRAYFDAEATARLFIKIAKELHLKIDTVRQ